MDVTVPLTDHPRILRWPLHVWRYRGWDAEFRRRRWLTPIFGWRFQCVYCDKRRWLP